MRKFSQVNNETSKSIDDAISEVSDLTSTIKENIDEVNRIATNQAAATQEITATLNDITAQASSVVDYINYKWISIVSLIGLYHGDSAFFDRKYVGFGIIKK